MRFDVGLLTLDTEVEVIWGIRTGSKSIRAKVAPAQYIIQIKEKPLKLCCLAFMPGIFTVPY